MSTFEIKMPKLGESITEGTIVRWSVKVGDTIHEDDILFEVTTAKVNAEVPSPVAGSILELLFQEGETVEVGTVVARVQLEEDVNAPSETKTEQAQTETPQAAKSEGAEKTQAENRWYSPVVLQLAQEANIPSEELETIPGTGYLGRLSKKDISNYIEQKKKGVEKPIAAKRLIPVSPPLPTATPEMPAVQPAHAVSGGTGDTEILDMDPVARIIADRMVQSRKTSAHVTTVVEADVSRLVNWRNRQKEAFQKNEGIPLTFMPAIVEATTRALREFPRVNASVEGHQFILKKQINIGIAVALADENLIVPVIRDADKLNINGLAQALDHLAKKARSNKLSLQDIEGGTFTITNFGTFRNLIGTPIINQPEVAILGVGYIEKKPAVVETPEGDVIAIRHKMYLSLSYDHRIINGSLGGSFLRRIADYLENWNG